MPDRGAIWRIQDNPLLQYRPEAPHISDLPEPATEPLPPEQIDSTDELYVTGLHLEQYRHATRSPEPYWREGLRRDPGDARMNNAMGLTALRRGEFKHAESFFRACIARLTTRNPNPRDGEPYYNLGLALTWQRRMDEAYAAFYKATWNGAWRSSAQYELAKIDCARGDFAEALQHLNESLERDAENLKAWDLKASVLRHMGRNGDAREVLEGVLRRDPLDFLALAEKWYSGSLGSDSSPEMGVNLDCDMQTALDVAYDYADGGLFQEAMAWLQMMSEGIAPNYPMIFYTLASLADRLGDENLAEHYRKCGADAPSLHCFPSRLEEMVVLQETLQRDPGDAKGNYYLGNLYYDRKRYEEAIGCWRDSVTADPIFSIPWRNLGIAEYNVHHDSDAALAAYAKAFEVNPGDARLLYEFDQLKKRAGFEPEERLAALEMRNDLIEQRDDLTVEYVALLNLTGRHQQAIGILLGRRFSPWEGGEGLVSSQYVEAHVALGRTAIETGDFVRAAWHFQQARIYPENLGEGKHLLNLERQLDYWGGLRSEANLRLGPRLHWRLE